MGRHTLEGNPPIEVTLRHSARAKRLSLRVSRLDGRVTLTLPKHAAAREGVSFLREKEAWLRGHLADIKPVMSLALEKTVLFRGEPCAIIPSSSRKAAFDGNRILVHPSRPIGAQIKGLFRQQARNALAAASDRYASAVGRTYSRLTIRDTRSRWGSCTAEGALMYSWRLIMAPPAVLDYVAAHEVAHLVEMNHQPAFWSVVAGVCPDYEVHRRWLRQNGDQLHQVSFDD